MTDLDVTGIGNACLDIVDQVDEAFLARFGMRKSHCIYIDRKTLCQIKESLPNHTLIPGGSVANTIHCLSLLNLNTSFQGIVSDDAEGTQFKKDLKDNNIKDLVSVSHSKDFGTTQVCCLVTLDGDRSFASYDGAARILAKEHLCMETVAKSKITYFDGYTLYSPTAEAAFIAAAETARAAGRLTAFNLADLSIVQTFPREVKTLADLSDILICNLAEIRALYGFETLEDCAAHLPTQKFAGAVTNGAHGSMIFKDGEVVYLPPTPAETKRTVIDTCGAGDHFAAGILYGLIKNLPLRVSANLAHLCALDCIGHFGAKPISSLHHLVAEAENMVNHES